MSRIRWQPLQVTFGEGCIHSLLAECGQFQFTRDYFLRTLIFSDCKIQHGSFWRFNFLSQGIFSAFASSPRDFWGVLMYDTIRTSPSLSLTKSTPPLRHLTHPLLLLFVVIPPKIRM